MDLEVEIRDPRTGQQRRCSASVVAVSGGEGASHALISLTDVTDAARMREELRVQATYDALTGCLNRASVIADLGRSLGKGELPVAAPAAEPVKRARKPGAKHAAAS